MRPWPRTLRTRTILVQVEKMTAVQKPAEPEQLLQVVLDKVAVKVTPTQEDRDKVLRLSKRLCDEVSKILTSDGFHADVSVQGSVARDTWVPGEMDLDIFAQFHADMDRELWTNKVLPSLREGLQRYPLIERYAEHPFLELHVDHVRVNIVPCYAVEQGKWKSATDRTPFHTRYMQSHLSNTLRLQARLLKKFTKGLGVYGAEVRVGGFSGMLVDTLTLKYGSFTQTLREAGRWKNHTLIELEPSGRDESALIAKFDASLAVVDPVDPNRNLAAAVRDDRLWAFVAASRQFLERPTVSYFYPPEPRRKTKLQISRRIEKRGYDLVVVAFPHPEMVPDVLWGQLFSLEKSIVGVATRYEFRILHSGVWSDEKRSSAVLLTLENAELPASRLHAGPPVSRKEETEAFLNRHLNAQDTLSGPRIVDDRWMVEKKRLYPDLKRLLTDAARQREMDLAVPAQLEKGFRSRSKVMLNREALRLYSRPGFGTTLWNFLDGRPAWLKGSRD
jgi:tRNA nucleotidyltransferase (CCA-adding enzyme)